MLSSRNYRKTQIIGALLLKPKTLLLDETTNGLDVKAVEELVRELKEVNRKSGTTIIFASHIMDHVEMLCERVMILNRRILADEKLSELKKKAGLKEYIETNIEKIQKTGDGEFIFVCKDSSEALVNLVKILA